MIVWATTAGISHRPRIPRTNTHALRVESKLGAGFERGIVFARIGVYASKNPIPPIAIDFADGCSQRYKKLGVSLSSDNFRSILSQVNIPVVSRLNPVLI
jgi:hypothetical protein